jgi:hypothetical protein
MKLQLYRQSGGIIDVSIQEKYDEAFKAFYDKADLRAREIHNNNIYSDGYALLMQRFLRFGERQLFKAFNQDVEIELPKTAKAWEKLIEKYQDTPIMLARTTDGKKLVLVIMDSLGG